MPPVETIKAAYAASGRTDPSVLVGGHGSGHHLERGRRLPACGWQPVRRRQGHRRGVFGRLLGAIDGFSVVPVTVIDGGDDVVVLGRHGGTLKASGVALDAQFCHVCRFRDGRVVSFQPYTDSAQWARLMP